MKERTSEGALRRALAPSKKTAYRPKQRQVRVDVLTPAGWLRGVMVVPHLQSLVDYLGHTGPFIKLVSVSMAERPEPIPFFALARSATLLLVPATGDDGIEAEGGRTTAPLDVRCLLERGSLEGRLDFLVNWRLSDYLRQQTDFLVLRDARWHAGPSCGHDAVVGRELACVLVNAAHIIGLEERRQGRPGLHPSEFPE